jgi:trimeric autotransporter adhesin
MFVLSYLWALQVRQATDAQSEAAALAQALHDRDAAAAEERVRRAAVEEKEFEERRNAAAALATAQAGLMDLFAKGLGTATDGFLAALRAHTPQIPPTQSPEQHSEVKTSPITAVEVLAEVRAEHDRQLRALVDLFAAQHASALRAATAATAAAAGAGSAEASSQVAVHPGSVVLPASSVAMGATDETGAYSADFEESGGGSSSVHDSVEPVDDSNSQQASDVGISTAAGAAVASTSLGDSVADEIGSVIADEEDSEPSLPAPSAAISAISARAQSSVKSTATKSSSVTASADIASRATKAAAVAAAAAAAASVSGADYSSSIGDESAAAIASSSVPEDDLPPSSPHGLSGGVVAASASSIAAASAISSIGASEIEDEVPSAEASNVSSGEVMSATTYSVDDRRGQRPAPATIVANSAAVVSDNSASASASAAYTEDFEDGDSGGGDTAAPPSARAGQPVAAAGTSVRGNTAGTVASGFEAEDDPDWGMTPGLLLPEAPPELAGDPTTAAALAAVRRSLREEGSRCREQLALLRMRETAADEAAAAELARIGEALRRLVAAGGGDGCEDEASAAAVRKLDERDRRVRLRLASERAELARLRAESRSEALRRQLMLHEQVKHFPSRILCRPYCTRIVHD